MTPASIAVRGQAGAPWIAETCAYLARYIRPAMPRTPALCKICTMPSKPRVAENHGFRQTG